MTHTYCIEQRRDGRWTTEGIGEAEGYPTAQEAEEAIESLAQNSTAENGYEWDGRYRVVDEDTTDEVVSQIRIGGLVRVSVDEDTTAEAWWDAAREPGASGWPGDRQRCPDSCLPLLEISGPKEVEVSRGDALAFEAWASRLPGWSDGPVTIDWE